VAPSNDNNNNTTSFRQPSQHLQGGEGVELIFRGGVPERPKVSDQFTRDWTVTNGDWNVVVGSKDGHSVAHKRKYKVRLQQQGSKHDEQAEYEWKWMITSSHYSLLYSLLHGVIVPSKGFGTFCPCIWLRNKSRPYAYIQLAKYIFHCHLFQLISYMTDRFRPSTDRVWLQLAERQLKKALQFRWINWKRLNHPYNLKWRRCWKEWFIIICMGGEIIAYLTLLISS
jgi:hypothetical protein